jgi:integrase
VHLLWTDRVRHSLLSLAAQTGLRAAELIGLRCADVHLGPSAHVRCHGKGRKQRITPLTSGLGTVCPTLAQKSATMHVLRHRSDAIAACWYRHVGNRALAPTRKYRLLRSTCMLIWRSRNVLWQGRRPRIVDQAAFAPLTSCSPFWKRSDYAASLAAITAPQARLAAVVGIIRKAA